MDEIRFFDVYLTLSYAMRCLGQTMQENKRLLVRSDEKKCFLPEWSPKDDLKFFSELKSPGKLLPFRLISLYEAYRTHFLNSEGK